MARDERGAATVEWTALVLAVSLALAAAVAVVPAVDGRSVGALLARSIACAVRGGCAEEGEALRRAYGERDAELVRRYAPGLVYEPGTLVLPVDWRTCRSHRCADAPDDRDLDTGRSRTGEEATAFTHVVHSGGETFIQYWLYYPDSTSTVGNVAGAWNTVRGAVGGPAYPGYHPDDWESVQVRIDRGGRVWTRASSHKAYQGCKRRRCRNRWTRFTGWSRVSRGSHAGHIPLRSRVRRVRARRRWPPLAVDWEDTPRYPGRDLRERTTAAPGLRLIPLETVERGSYRPLDPGIKPPWRKRVWTDPRSNSTG